MPIIPPPPMTPEKAREVGHSLKATADYLAEAGDLGFAHTMQRQSEWYLAHALTLATIQSWNSSKP